MKAPRIRPNDLPEHLKVAAKRARKNEAEPLRRSFEDHCRANEIPAAEAEHRFHPTRKWRFDFAWPEQRVALEMEGGVWTKGRHTRPKGFLKDMQKYNAAAVLGWRVVRVTPKGLFAGATVQLLHDMLSPLTEENR